MILEICLTFIATSAFYGGLLYLACRRVARHLQGNADAVKQVKEHVVVPLLGGKAKV